MISRWLKAHGAETSSSSSMNPGELRVSKAPDGLRTGCQPPSRMTLPGILASMRNNSPEWEMAPPHGYERRALSRLIKKDATKRTKTGTTRVEPGG